MEEERYKKVGRYKKGGRYKKEGGYREGGTGRRRYRDEKAFLVLTNSGFI